MVPAWRGLSHELAVVPVAVFGIWVVVAADGLVASVALTTHAIFLVAMLVTSSIYHRHAHSPEAKLWVDALTMPPYLVSSRRPTLRYAYWPPLGGSVYRYWLSPGSSRRAEPG